MNLQPSQLGLSAEPEYPPPPRIHWFVLLLCWWVLGTLIARFAPKPYQNLLNSLVVDAWAFYLCLWIRQLDPDARCIFWCDAYLVVELTCAALTIQQHSTPTVTLIWGILAMASTILGIATIFLIRADLEKHYNEREPIGLHLSGGLTFFLSFLYFQSQLYPIAQLKKRQSEELAASTGRTLLP